MVNEVLRDLDYGSHCGINSVFRLAGETPRSGCLRESVLGSPNRKLDAVSRGSVPTIDLDFDRIPSR